MPPAARLGDMHACPMVTPGTPPVPHVGGPITGPCAPTVLINFQPAARVSDLCTCVGPPDMISQGSPTVTICFLPAARMGDLTAHGGSITMGSPNVIIGNSGGGGGGGGGGSGGGGPTPAAGEGGRFEAVDEVPVGKLTAPEKLSSSAALSPGPQSKVLKAAAKAGAAFVEPCKDATGSGGKGRPGK